MRQFSTQKNKLSPVLFGGMSSSRFVTADRSSSPITLRLINRSVCLLYCRSDRSNADTTNDI